MGGKEKMRNPKNWVLLLFFGSLWGIMEIVGGEILRKNNIPYTSVWLSAWAFFVLAIARGILNKPGSSSVIGAFAALFKLVNASPFFCHLLGIFFLGLAFDVASTLLMRNERKISYRSIISGILSAYGGFALFALVSTYIVRDKFWVSGGLAKVLHHIFVSGSFTAMIAILLVPLGYWVGINGGIMVKRRPRWAYSGALIALVILWTLGRIAR
jgi:hypothetical protein